MIDKLVIMFCVVFERFICSGVSFDTFKVSRLIKGSCYLFRKCEIFFFEQYYNWYQNSPEIILRGFVKMRL